MLAVAIPAVALNMEQFLDSIYNSSTGMAKVEMTQVASTIGFDVSEETALTNTVHPLFTMTHTTSGTAADNIGVGIDFIQEQDLGTTEIGGRLNVVASDITGATEDFDMMIMLMQGGATAAERWHIDSGGVVTQSASTAATNAVEDVLNIKHSTSGTEADGIGIGILFTQETGAVDEIIASIDAVATDVTGATEDGEIVFSTMTAGAAATEKLRIHDSGEVEFQKGIVPDAVTADPCGSGFPEGAIFYDTTGNVLCFCDGTNDLKISDGNACY